MCVCVCARLGRDLRCPGGVLGCILGAWAPFWSLLGSLGSIFEALGVPCAPFLELWGPNGWLWVSSEAPLAAQGAQSEIFPILFPPIWGSFWDHFRAKSASKSDAFFDGFFNGFFVVVWLILR